MQSLPEFLDHKVSRSQCSMHSSIAARLQHAAWIAVFRLAGHKSKHTVCRVELQEDGSVHTCIG